MRIGMVGLGRMGANMTRRLTGGAIDVVAFDASEGARQALVGLDRVAVAESLPALVTALPHARIVWMMLPSGDVSETAIGELADLLEPGDLIVDGANAYYKDSMRRASELAARGIAFIDAGVSGGIWGLANGYAVMAGGAPEAFARVLPLVKVLAPAPDRGWMHCGPAGAGHFVKMIHNGIEYGMMQAYAEGLALLVAKKEFALDIAAVTEMWRDGTVIRSWLLDLIAGQLKDGAALEGIKPIVADSGEGRWTALEAVDLGVPAPVITLALMMRFASQGSNDQAAKLLSLMRAGFGGHAVQRESGAGAAH